MLTITASQDAMGDYTSPKRRDLLDKLRRRMESYKRHHNGAQQRFMYGQKAIYEQERQHSLILRQRVLDSKAAKKASKSKSKSDSTASDHRSQIVTVSAPFSLYSFHQLSAHMKITGLNIVVCVTYKP